jgi:hypothetical protein
MDAWDAYVADQPQQVHLSSMAGIYAALDDEVSMIRYELLPLYEKVLGECVRGQLTVARQLSRYAMEREVARCKIMERAFAFSGVETLDDVPDTDGCVTQRRTAIGELNAMYRQIADAMAALEMDDNRLTA